MHTVNDRFAGTDPVKIGEGKFADMYIQLQSELGVKSTRANIKAGVVTVGYIEISDITKFITGDASVFSPIPAWKTRLSTALMRRLGLSV